MTNERYHVNVANVGTILVTDDYDEAVHEAEEYHSGEHGARAAEEAAYVFDMHAGAVVFEIESRIGEDHAA